MKTIKFLFIIVAILFANYSYSCTTFTIKTEDEYVFGRNYDFMIGYGYVFVNKKNVMKTPSSTTEAAADWVSKYGSVTFNQFGREFPTGGINEAGLVVELMWLDETKYPAADSRPSTGSVLQWIQYQLDNCETVQEVIDTDKEIRIPSKTVPLHFLISDKYGNTATIEFLDGKLVSFMGDKLQQPVLTNDTYEKSLNYFNSVSRGMQRIDYEKSSLNRFVKACSMVSSYKKEAGVSAVDYGFKILSDVSQGSATKWSIVYDIKNMKIFYKTYDNENVRYVDISEIDFNCITPVKMIDMNDNSKGKVNGLMTEYNHETNRKLIEDSYNGVDFLKKTPDEVRDRNAKYPDGLECRSKSSNEPDKNYQSNDEKNYSGLYFILTGVVIIVGFIAGFEIRKRSTKN